MQIGHVLRDMRKRARLTQSDMAECLNVTRTSISHIENDRINPSWTTVKTWVERCGSKISFNQAGEVVTTDELVLLTRKASSSLDNDERRGLAALLRALARDEM